MEGKKLESIDELLARVEGEARLVRRVGEESRVFRETGYGSEVVATGQSREKAEWIYQADQDRRRLAAEVRRLKAVHSCYYDCVSKKEADDRIAGHQEKVDRLVFRPEIERLTQRAERGESELARLREEVKDLSEQHRSDEGAHGPLLDALNAAGVPHFGESDEALTLLERVEIYSASKLARLREGILRVAEAMHMDAGGHTFTALRKFAASLRELAGEEKQ